MVCVVGERREVVSRRTKEWKTRKKNRGGEEEAICVCVEMFWLIVEEEEAINGNKVENHCDFLLTTISKLYLKMYF